MPGIDVLSLRCLEASARLGSLTAAARSLGVSQPAVSVQIAGIERRVGSRLLERSSRGVRLTPAGERVLERAQRILDEISALEGDGGSGPLRGVLRIGSTDVVVLHRLPEVLRRFRAAHPGVEIVLRVEGSVDLAEAVRAREVELALVTLPVPDPPGAIVPLYRDRLCFVASPRHPLARRRRLDLATLAEAPLLGHKEGSVTRSLVSGLMTSRGVPPRFVMEVSSPEVLRQLARSGFGVAVLPEVSVREEVRRGHLTILKVVGWELDRVSGLLLPPAGPASRAGREFRDLLLRPSRREGSRRGSRSGPRAPRGRSGAPGSGRALPEAR